ncbi:hypothetical protein RND71_030537 [Anisodus tanguticus]|uniref:Uncharacterized protein n=1 Tax=Anisodus tanguticus TaxID=243964 RepID=A0AAE1RFF8_9SOLA|nr:hypothetical protein RND71_030537 [Anisodus tanguticus]
MREFALLRELHGKFWINSQGRQTTENSCKSKGSPCPHLTVNVQHLAIGAAGFCHVNPIFRVSIQQHHTGLEFDYKGGQPPALPTWPCVGHASERFSKWVLTDGEALDCLVATCDVGRASSSGPLDLSCERTRTASSRTEVAPIPRAVLVPKLEQPLLTDIQRRAELQQRLAFYFIGKNERTHLPLFLGILEKQVLLE